MKCDNCGQLNAQLIWSGYVTPISDAAPTYQEWQEKYLCQECIDDFEHPTGSYGESSQGQKL